VESVTEPGPKPDPQPAQPAGNPSRLARIHAHVVPKELAEVPVTRALLYANVAVFVAELGRARKLSALANMPSDVMLWFGANHTPFTVADHRWETLLTSCFLHFSVLHLAFNLVALRQVGQFVEKTVGPARFAPLYLASGVVGSLASTLQGVLMNQARLAAGASGAICGLIGAALVLGLRTQGWRGPLTQAMARWLGIIVLLGFLPRLDNAAHVAGAASGAAIAAMWRRGVTYSRTKQRVIVLFCTLVTLGALAKVFLHDALDRYASLDAGDRLRLATRALATGDCKTAREAAQRAARLDRRSYAARIVMDEIERGCAGR
jgi:rhomboid protease GluP